MTDEARETLAARIQRLRLAKKMTQQQLAIAAGLTISAVTQIEQGVTGDPRLSSLRGLARALDVTLDELAGEDGS